MLGSGSKLIAAAATQLSTDNVPIKSVTITLPLAALSFVRLGGPGITLTTGTELQPGEAVIWGPEDGVNNLNEIWGFANNGAGDLLSFAYGTR